MDFRETYEALSEEIPRDVAWILSAEAMHSGKAKSSTMAWRLWMCADRVWIAATGPEQLVKLVRQYVENGRPVGVSPNFYP